MAGTLTIKQLHAATGRLVRAAAKAATPTVITDHGRPVAILSSPESLPAPARHPRRTTPEYEAMMRQHSQMPLSEDLDFVRGDR